MDGHSFILSKDLELCPLASVCQSVLSLSGTAHHSNPISKPSSSNKILIFKQTVILDILYYKFPFTTCNSIVFNPQVNYRNEEVHKT